MSWFEHPPVLPISAETRELIDRAIKEVKDRFSGEKSGHDEFHILRVCHLAQIIAVREGGDTGIILLAAALHEMDDHKFNGGTFGKSQNTRRFLEEHRAPEAMTDRICQIVSEISYRGEDSVAPESLEGKIVQDADRLDAIGAIGVARAFTFGGYHHQLIHDPLLPMREGPISNDDTLPPRTTIQHFYDKLLKLKEMMNTETGWRMAQKRHQFLIQFLDQFYEEWEEPF